MKRKRQPNLTERIAFRLEESVHAQFVAICERQRRKISDLARIVIEDYVADQAKRSAPGAIKHSMLNEP